MPRSPKPLKSQRKPASVRRLETSLATLEENANICLVAIRYAEGGWTSGGPEFFGRMRIEEATRLHVGLLERRDEVRAELEAARATWPARQAIGTR